MATPCVLGDSGSLPALSGVGEGEQNSSSFWSARSLIFWIIAGTLAMNHVNIRLQIFSKSLLLSFKPTS